MIEKNENDSNAAALLITKFKEWHAQGTKKTKDFLSKIFYLNNVVVLNCFFPSYLNYYHNLDLSDFVYLNYLLKEILK